jgi:hypothetical protein
LLTGALYLINGDVFTKIASFLVLISGTFSENRSVMASHGAASTRLRPWTHVKGKVLLKDGSEIVNVRITDISDGGSSVLFTL